MTAAISAAGLTRRYRDHTALRDIDLDLSAGTITGLLGRNGAGKTTLLRILAGQEFPSGGSVRVLGAPPAENEDVLRRLVLVREDQAYPEIKVGQALRAASWCYPHWDPALASALIDDFGLRPKKAVKALSRGQRSALGITIGLAARADVTLFDEPYAGLDAVDALTAGRPVRERRSLGSQSSVVVVGPLSPDDREQARSAGLDLTPLSLQQVVVQAAAGFLSPAPPAGFATERASA